jgi:hypothetical protein
MNDLFAAHVSDLRKQIHDLQGLETPTFTAGSVLFGGSSGAPAQDNANLFWDDTNDRLGLGTAAPTHPLHLVATFGKGIKLENTANSVYSFLYGGDPGTTVGATTLTYNWRSNAAASASEREDTGLGGCYLTMQASRVDLNAVDTSGTITRLAVFTNTSGCQIFASSADTTQIRTALNLFHRSTGSIANGFGLQMPVQAQDTTTQDVLMANTIWSWVDATHASRKARAQFNVYDTAAREAFRIEASGSAAMIGFLGHVAVVRQTVAAAAPAGGTGAAAGGWDTAAHRDSAITLINDMRTALINLGLCV